MREQLDAAFPGNAGPCGFCGDTLVGGRHRVIDAIAERIRAGEPWESVCADYTDEQALWPDMAVLALAVSGE